jgi:DNA integrity scanning protein DisA with diadenylate cyclase activity
MGAQKRLPDQFRALCRLAVQLAKAEEADALLVLLDRPTDWQALKKLTGKQSVLVAADLAEQVAGADEAGLATVLLDMDGSPVYERLTQALLEGVADDLLPPSGCVVAIYSGFEAGVIDSLSVVHLDEHLGRLTVRDLRQLETRVPLDTLKTVVDLAVAIGREGREGKPVGAFFIVGDHRRVLAHCHPTGFDPVKGYSRKERHLDDPRVREGIREIAQIDGAILIAADGTVESAAQYVSAPAAGITLSKGLGTKHWAAAGITRATNAIAVVVSETNGTVRIFENGEIMLRIEPFRRAMKWTDFEYEPPSSSE